MPGGQSQSACLFLSQKQVTKTTLSFSVNFIFSDEIALIKTIVLYWEYGWVSYRALFSKLWGCDEQYSQN